MASIVIIGAGLAGSLMASKLAGYHRITVIEQSRRNRPLRVFDRGRPAALEAHAGSGFGGTTYLWHNGLIELEDGDFGAWPLPAAEVRNELAAAHRALSGTPIDLVQEIGAELRASLVSEGMPGGLLGLPLFYPIKRRNVWKSEHLPERGVTTVVGRVERLAIDDGGRVRGAYLADRRDPVTGDIFVLAAGGLGSPLILQASGDNTFANAGRFYNDHPAAYVAEITVRANLNRLWNRFDRRLNGSVRLPLVIATPRQKFAFYLRPAGPAALKVKSVLSDLRNAPFDPRHYARLMMHTNDIVEALSLRAGINIPTRRFVLYMCAEQVPQDGVSVRAQPDGISRDWRLGEDFVAAATAAIERVIAALAPVTERSTVFADWPDDIQTAAHHSGTCRMAAAAAAGVCDRDGRVFGTANLFVCDGSVLPATGYANTGLTIGALALRMADTVLA
jgi:choline dehydrogenase-like flavoprotein